MFYLFKYFSSLLKIKKLIRHYCDPTHTTGSSVCHFLPMWTHHDVTLQQQRRFDGHTQPPASGALKVTVDNTADTNKPVK